MRHLIRENPLPGNPALSNLQQILLPRMRHLKERLMGLAHPTLNPSVSEPNTLNLVKSSEDLAKSVLTLLFKTGDAKDVKNYRPISLLNTDWKLLCLSSGKG